MQLFIDSADVAELRAAAASGLIDGVTTNPSLIAKSGRKMKEAIADYIKKIQDDPKSSKFSNLYHRLGRLG